MCVSMCNMEDMDIITHSCLHCIEHRKHACSTSIRIDPAEPWREWFMNGHLENNESLWLPYSRTASKLGPVCVFPANIASMNMRAPWSQHYNASHLIIHVEIVSPPPVFKARAGHRVVLQHYTLPFSNKRRAHMSSLWWWVNTWYWQATRTPSFYSRTFALSELQSNVKCRRIPIYVIPKAKQEENYIVLCVWAKIHRDTNPYGHLGNLPWWIVLWKPNLAPVAAASSCSKGYDTEAAASVSSQIEPRDCPRPVKRNDLGHPPTSLLSHPWCRGCFLRSRHTRVTKFAPFFSR